MTVAWWLGMLAAAQTLRMPEPTATVPAVYPADALADGRGADVELSVTIAPSGRVDHVLVLSPPAAGFDDNAVAALRDYRFEAPVDEQGRPAVVTVRYLLPFRPESARLPSLVGQLRADRPLAGVALRLDGPEGALRTAITDADGCFALAGLRAGPWVVTVESAEARGSVAVEVSADGLAEVVLALGGGEPVVRAGWLRPDGVQELVVLGHRLEPEIVEHRLSMEDLRYLPGSAGDPVKAIQNFPGVGRTPLGLGQLIIRGMGPEDNRFSLDGVDIPQVFHFAGVTTVVPGDALSEVTYLPGGYGVRYGRALGGRVDLRMSDDIPDRHAGMVSVDLFQVQAWAELRASERTAVSISLRRSYIDAVLTPLLSEGDLQRRFPHYYDGLVRVVHRPPGGGTLDALALVSDDSATVGFRGADGVFRALSTYDLVFERFRLRWQGPAGPRWTQELTLHTGPDVQSFVDGVSDSAREERWAVDVRAEVRGELKGGVRMRLGFDGQSGTTSFRYDLPDFGPDEGGQTWYVAPALYVEPTWVRGPLTLTSGLRADLLTWGGESTSWSVDPRVAAAVRLPHGLRLVAAVGRYTQFPLARQVLESADGTAGLKPPWTLQSTLGVEWELPFGLRVELRGWLNAMFELIVGRDDRFRFLPGPLTNGPLDVYPYDNAGRGLTGGLEVMLRYDSERVLAWFAGTFGRSWRTGRDQEGPSPYTFDQPWGFNALASAKLPRQWRVGGRVRLWAGHAYTPVAQRVYDLDLRTFFPVYGEPGSARLPTFFTFDVRIDKSWLFRKWSFSIYLDAQNVTNTRNIDVIGWSWDWATERGILGLPIVPAFGLRADW